MVKVSNGGEPDDELLHQFFGYPPQEGCEHCVAGVYHGDAVSPNYIGKPVQTKGIPIATITSSS